MTITIKTFEEENVVSREKYFGAHIYINKRWFKEITGLSTKSDLIKSIFQNEDLLKKINK